VLQFLPTGDNRAGCCEIIELEMNPNVSKSERQNLCYVALDLWNYYFIRKGFFF
jgi:hypothetical protein